MADLTPHPVNEPDRVTAIRRRSEARDWQLVVCGETGRTWLVDRADPDPRQALLAEVLCPRTEPLQVVINEDIPDLLAEIDRLRAAFFNNPPSPALDQPQEPTP